MTICFFSQYLVSAEPTGCEIKTIPTLDHSQDGISVQHGHCCLESASAPIEDDKSVPIPPWANDATVFLNGWHAKYLFGPQPIGEISISIRDVEIRKGIEGEPDTLNWKAICLMTSDGNVPYRFCYYFTIIFWGNSKIKATSYNYNNINSIHKSSSDDQPLLILPSYLKTNDIGEKTAILPRGFEFYEGGTRYSSSLLQIAYNIDHTENIIEDKSYGNLGFPPNPPVVDSWIGTNFVSWDTQAVLKDSDDVLDYTFTDYVTALNGEDIDIIQPPFTISPQLSYYGWGGGQVGGQQSHSAPRIIENVPFIYAIPVLAGWDLKYSDEKDHRVQEIGVWIDNFEYKFDPINRYNSLRYKISYLLLDDLNLDPDKQPGFLIDYKVNILGIKGTRHVPDLVPVPGYCNPPDNRQLGIMVSNKNKVGAPSTTTTVSFKPGGNFNIWTPGIGGPGQVKISCPVPETFWKYQQNKGYSLCDFDIQVDSLQEVIESDEQNNNGKGVCVRYIIP